MTIGLALLSLLYSCATAPCVPDAQGVPIEESQLVGEFLLQVSYERKRFEPFMTSRSRIISFRRLDDTLLMLEAPRDSRSSHRPLMTIPILSQSDDTLVLDLNTGLDRVYLEEDRTGEDYYGRVDRNDYSYFRLFQREMRKVQVHGTTLVLEQHALDWSNEPVVVHYYLRPYEPDPDFKTVEIENLEHFGFFQTYPQRQRNRTVLYATKFGVQKPIVFALSPEIPVRYRQAVREGILYWNKALGRPLLRAVDAPEGVTAPSAEYNVIEWKAEGAHASTAHIQTDPRTGQILHAHIFVVPDRLKPDDHVEQSNHLRYVVAHEVGHALGLRHNFAHGPVSTVMNYFSFEEAARVGREVVAEGDAALEYDRLVIRDIYLHQRHDVDLLPAFCTDDQRGCHPLSQAGLSSAAPSGR